MDDPPNRHPRALEFRVVCRHKNATAYILHRSASNAAAAMESARAAGHEPMICMPFGLSRSEETRIITRWRYGQTACSNCGYELSGLPAGPCLTCPECGLGSAPARAAVPHCSECGYCMSGIAVGIGPVRCPECGSTSPFLNRT